MTTPLEKQIRTLLWFFIIALVLSGLTAFPIEWQLSLAHEWINYWKLDSAAARQIELFYDGARQTNLQYPFIAYGTDWLAFAHLVIAVAFIGPLRDPIKNIWVVEFGLIACAGIFPLTFIAGPIREIPFAWSLVDCSFGIFGGIILWTIRKKIKSLEKLKTLVA